MDDIDNTASPLQTAAGGTSQHAAKDFELLGNETRLSLLVALWEAYEPFADDNTMSFSELRNQVGVRDSGQFNYHLDKLVGRFVEKSDDGYELRRAGHRIVRSTIASAGVEDSPRERSEIGIVCPFCDAPTAVTYQEDWLYIVCTECDGFFEGEDRPRGMLSGTEFDPAGLANRTAEEQWRAGWLAGKNAMQLAVEGVCNECSGPMEHSIDICEIHATEGVCDNCDRQSP